MNHRRFRSATLTLATVTAFFMWMAPLAARAQEANAGAAPNIEVADTEYKAEVAEGDPVEHVFKVKNSGKAPLEITDVKTSCGCTAALLSKDGKAMEKGQKMVLAPGEGGEIKTTFNTKGYSGEVRKTITVFSNDPDSPQSAMNLLVTVKQEISVTPSPSVFFSGLLKDQTDQKMVEVASATDAPLKITKVESSNPMFVAEMKEVEAGKKYQITVSTKPPLSEGSVTGVVTLETNNAKKPKVELQVNAYVIAEITASPNQIIFKGKNDKVKTLYVNGPYTKKDLKINKVGSDLEFISMNLVPVIEGQTYRVEVTLGDGAPEEFKGEIKIENSSKGTPVLSVPVIGQKG